MTAPNIPLLPTCLIGGTLAAIAYIGFAKSKRNIIHCLEAVMFGVALGAACHLMYGAVFPEHLVEVLGENDRHLHPPEIKVKMDTMHALDILVGGAFLIYLAGRGILSLIKHQNQSSTAE